MLGELQPWHIIIVLLAFVLLFGSKKLPDTARSLGRSLRMFKSEMNQLREESSPAPTRVEPSAGSGAQDTGAQTSGAQTSAERPAPSAPVTPTVSEPAREPVAEPRR